MLGRLGRLNAVVRRGATTSTHLRKTIFTVGCAAATFAYATQAQCKSMANMRVVTYNVLSDSLDAPDHYTFCDPKDLDGETRFQRVCAKLEVEMNQGAILCLQEVSRTWGAKLVPFFEKHGYTHTTALTGSKFGGYMGQCIAWPSKKFKAIEIETIRASDTVEGWPTPEKPAAAKDVPLTLWQRIVDEKPEKVKLERPPFNPWTEAEKRHNAFIMARLQDKESGKQFSLATYHMPCLFGSDAKCSVMTIHLALLFQAAERFAKGEPLIVTGDFNMKPDSSQYALVTNGSLPVGHPQNPESPMPDFKLAVRPMRSAYVVHSGSEPEYTNLARTKFNKDGSFIETLDYIWISEHVSVTAVRALPTRASQAGVHSNPTKDEPSDHIMISADVAF